MTGEWGRAVPGRIGGRWVRSGPGESGERDTTGCATRVLSVLPAPAATSCYSAKQDGPPALRPPARPGKGGGGGDRGDSQGRCGDRGGSLGKGSRPRIPPRSLAGENNTRNVLISQSRLRPSLFNRGWAVCEAHRAMPVVALHTSSSSVFLMLHLQSWHSASALQHLP